MAEEVKVVDLTTQEATALATALIEALANSVDANGQQGTEIARLFIPPSTAVILSDRILKAMQTANATTSRGALLDFKGTAGPVVDPP